MSFQFNPNSPQDLQHYKNNEDDVWKVVFPKGEYIFERVESDDEYRPIDVCFKFYKCNVGQSIIPWQFSETQDPYLNELISLLLRAKNDRKYGDYEFNQLYEENEDCEVDEDYLSDDEISRFLTLFGVNTE
jgi:hypothetical protein